MDSAVGRAGAGSKLVTDEVDSSVCQEGNDNTNDCVQDSVFSACNSVLVTSRYNVADTTDDQHDHRDGTDNEQ